MILTEGQMPKLLTPRVELVKHLKLKENLIANVIKKEKLNIKSLKLKQKLIK